MTTAAELTDAFETEYSDMMADCGIRSEVIGRKLDDLRRLLDVVRSESQSAAEGGGADKETSRVVWAARNWRECDTSQSDDRGMNCGCLDLLADAVDAFDAALRGAGGK